MKKLLKIATLFIVAGTIAFTAGYSITSLAVNNVVRIGHKEFTEQRILGQLFAVYLESKGYKTEVIEYPNTWYVFEALEAGDIDIYPEYTGTLYGVIFNQAKALGKDETYNYVKSNLESEYGMTLLKPLGWTNAYVLYVRPETAQKYRFKTISDIIPFANQMTLGSDLEFTSRQDGLIGLSGMYPGLYFRRIEPMNPSLTYQALIDGNTDINASYSTDTEIEKYGLVKLIDDKNFFPPYYVAPILKKSFAEKNPEIVADLEKLENQWTEAEIIHYNHMVDEGQDPRTVAEMMLRDKGLI